MLYQIDDLEFEIERLIQNSPELGSSWFELVDFNKDGHLDIILTTGDNADYSPFPKPYHGLSIYLNDGKNQFIKKYFHPIYGATRVLTKDYDFDGDIDFAILSFFPEENYSKSEKFIYLETLDPYSFIFNSYTLGDVFSDRWMVMDHGDVDLDGDFDIILGAFALSIEEKLLAKTKGETVVLLLENTQN